MKRNCLLICLVLTVFLFAGCSFIPFDDLLAENEKPGSNETHVEIRKDGESRLFPIFNEDGQQTGYKLYTQPNILSAVAEFGENGKVQKYTYYRETAERNKLPDTVSGYALYEYDDNGRQTKISSYDENDGLKYYYVYSYDENGWCTSKEYDASSNLKGYTIDQYATVTASNGSTSTYTKESRRYDASDNLESTRTREQYNYYGSNSYSYQDKEVYTNGTTYYTNGESSERVEGSKRIITHKYKTTSDNYSNTQKTTYEYDKDSGFVIKNTGETSSTSSNYSSSGTYEIVYGGDCFSKTTIPYSDGSFSTAIIDKDRKVRTENSYDKNGKVYHETIYDLFSGKTESYSYSDSGNRYLSYEKEYLSTTAENYKCTYYNEDGTKKSSEICHYNDNNRIVYSEYRDGEDNLEDSYEYDYYANGNRKTTKCTYADGHYKITTYDESGNNGVTVYYNADGTPMNQ